MFPTGTTWTRAFCIGAYGEYCSLLRNFGGFKLVTNLKETMEAKCKSCCPQRRRRRDRKTTPLSLLLANAVATKTSPSIAKIPSTYSYTRKNKYEKCNIRSEAIIKDEP